MDLGMTPTLNGVQRTIVLTVAVHGDDGVSVEVLAAVANLKPKTLVSHRSRTDYLAGLERLQWLRVADGIVYPGRRMLRGCDDSGFPSSLEETKSTRPPWELALPAIDDIEARINVDSIFETDLASTFGDFKVDLEHKATELGMDLADEWHLYVAILWVTMLVEVLARAEDNAAVTHGTVLAAARTARIVTAVLASHLSQEQRQLA